MHLVQVHCCLNQPANTDLSPIHAHVTPIHAHVTPIPLNSRQQAYARPHPLKISSCPQSHRSPPTTLGASIRCLAVISSLCTSWPTFRSCCLYSHAMRSGDCFIASAARFITKDSIALGWRSLFGFATGWRLLTLYEPSFTLNSSIGSFGTGVCRCAPVSIPVIHITSICFTIISTLIFRFQQSSTSSIIQALFITQYYHLSAFQYVPLMNEPIDEVIYDFIDGFKHEVIDVVVGDNICCNCNSFGILSTYIQFYS